MKRKMNNTGEEREREGKRKRSMRNRTDKCLSLFSGWFRSRVLGKMSGDGGEYHPIFNRVQKEKTLTN